MFDDYEAECIDAVLYGGDNREDTRTPYGANGVGAPVYGVVARHGDTEWEIYDGTDAAEAEALAICTYRRHGGRAYVSVLLDGGSWRHVSHVPDDVSTAALTDSGCLHPRCGQIHPLSCYCGQFMTPEERERWRTEYA